MTVWCSSYFFWKLLTILLTFILVLNIKNVERTQYIEANEGAWLDYLLWMTSNIVAAADSDETTATKTENIVVKGREKRKERKKKKTEDRRCFGVNSPDKKERDIRNH